MENTKSTKQLSNNISLEDIITTSIKIPGVKVNRDKFLAEQFAGTGANIQDIINLGPIDAGISREDISNTANKLIIKRTSQSSVASFVAGIPGGPCEGSHNSGRCNAIFWNGTPLSTRIVIFIWWRRFMG